MSLDLSALSQLPGIKYYLSRLGKELGRGCSVLSIMPKNLYAESIWQLCIDSLWQANLDVEELDLVANTEEAPPIMLLSERYSHQNGHSNDLGTLMSCRLPQIVALRGLETTSPSTRTAWISLFKTWATYTQRNISKPGYQPTGLWGIYSLDDPNNMLPLTDTWLYLHPWWSVISALDIQMLCRLSDGVGQSNLSPYIAWRESLMTFLAGNDLDVVERLWHIMDSKRETIYNTLLQIAQERNWTIHTLEKWGVTEYLKSWQRASRRFVQFPVRDENLLWLRGVIYQTPEYGTQVSAVALAVLEKWELLDHLCWRGQTTLLLPLIDEYRLSVCQELTDRYGPDWAWQWSKPISDEVRKQLMNNPMAAEWGHLENSIRRSPHHTEKNRLTAICTARHIRNQLAHYKPITFQDYELFMSQLT